MPSRQTLSQRQVNNLYEESRPSDVDKINASKYRKRLDATRELFKKYKGTILGSTLEIFGPDLFVRGGLLLTPLDVFNNPGTIAYATRVRSRDRYLRAYPVYSFIRERHYRNYNYDEVNYLSDAYLVSENNLDFSYWMYPVEIPSDFCFDTTVKTRTQDVAYSEYTTSANKNSPQFGELSMQQVRMVSDDVRLVFHNFNETFFYPTGKYDRYEEFAHYNCEGPLAVPDGPLFIDDIDEKAFVLMNDNVAGILPDALLDVRLWDPFYQFFELKDLKDLPSAILNFKEYVRKLVVDSVKNPTSIPKKASDAFLSYQFGLLSVIKSTKDLFALSERATKRFNYLLDRAGKLTTSRAKRNFLNVFPDWKPPSFTFHLPPWCEVLDEDVTYMANAELRIVVSQWINWPKVAVPSFSDSNYRKILGLEASLEDLYNAVPWTWMFDWYTGLGEYLGMFQAIHSDRNLVNTGFVTVVITETITHSAKLKVMNGTRNWLMPDAGDTTPPVITFDETTERLFPYRRKYIRKTQKRLSLGSFDGVKTFGFWQQNLTDYQSKILGALFLQRT